MKGFRGIQWHEITAGLEEGGEGEREREMLFIEQQIRAVELPRIFLHPFLLSHINTHTHTHTHTVLIAHNLNCELELCTAANSRILSSIG